MAFQVSAFQNDAFQIFNNLTWFRPLSEPVRVRSRFPANLGYIAKSPYIGAADPHTQSWFRPLSEPVRSKPPLTSARVPFHFLIVARPQFTLAVAETGDSPAIVFVIPEFSLSVTEMGDDANIIINRAIIHNRARVTITEVPFSGQANVTIWQINYSRGYS